MNDEVLKNLEGNGRGVVEILSQYFLDGPRKITRNLR
jgi:hypothetical protein